MRRVIFVSVMMWFFILSGVGHAQIDGSKIIVSVDGLAQKYSKLFLSNKSTIADAINNTVNVTTRPLAVRVFFEDAVGTIQITANYDTDALFDSTSKHHNHYMTWIGYGSGGFVSLYGVKQLMGVLESYRNRVALSVGDSVQTMFGNRSVPNEEINNFYLSVRLVKRDQSWVQFHGNWMIDQNGVKRFGFARDALIKFKKMQPVSFRALHPDELNGWLKFYLGKSIGLDGKSTEYFNVYKFFNLPMPNESK